MKDVLSGALLALVLTAVQLQAQELEGWSPREFEVAVARLQFLPPEEKNQRLVELMSQYYLDQAWALSRGRNDGTQKPKVVVRDSELPVFVEGGELSVPLDFFPQMAVLALLLGHDASVSIDGDISVVSPLLYRPFTEGHLLAIAPDLGGLFDSERFGAAAGFAQFASCGPQAPACQHAQAAAMLCAPLFIVAHEVTHVREAHKPRRGGSYPLEEELQADAGGMKVLRSIVRNLQSSGDFHGAAELACLATPAAYFELNRRRAPTGLAQQNYERRKEAMLAQSGSAGDEIQTLVEPDVLRSGLGIVQVSWLVTPSLVILDGVEVDVGDLDRFVLPAGRHRILASGPSGIGSVEFRVSHGQVAHVSLELKAYNSLPASEVATLVVSKRWTEVLQATSDSDLRPKSLLLATTHWNALRHLRLGAWIDARDFAEVEAREARQAKSWRTTGLPLSRWDPDLISAID